MMRKDQVLASAVYIKSLAQVLGAHGRALYMPARPAPAPWTVPCRLTGLGCLPQHKVKRVFLARVHLHPGTGLHVPEAPAGKLAVFRPPGNRKKNVTVHAVCISLLLQYFYNPNNLGDMICGKRLQVRLTHVKRGHVPAEFVNIFAGNLVR